MTIKSIGIAIEMKIGPKCSACATSARAINAPDRMDRNIVTRLRASLYVRARVASRLQCSVARICSLAAAPASPPDPAGGISVDMSLLLYTNGPCLDRHGTTPAAVL